MNKVVVWLSAVAGMGVVVLSVSTTGCNGGGSCTYKSKCGGDTPQTADAITLCENTLANPTCGGYYSSYLSCFQSNQVCTSTGVTDEDLSNGPCGDKLANYENCCFGGEGGVADGGFPQCGN